MGLVKHLGSQEDLRKNVSDQKWLNVSPPKKVLMN